MNSTSCHSNLNSNSTFTWPIAKFNSPSTLWAKNEPFLKSRTLLNPATKRAPKKRNETYEVTNRGQQFLSLFLSTRSASYTWSASTAVSRAEEAKGWRSSVMNPAQTPNTEPDRSQRNASTSTGEAAHRRTHTHTCTNKRSCFFHGLHHPPASVPAISYYWWLQLTPLCMQHSSVHRSLSLQKHLLSSCRPSSRITHQHKCPTEDHVHIQSDIIPRCQHAHTHLL